MIDEPKVTVGIPTYNRPEGVLRTIRQIAGQTYSNLEIIVSNNASTDGEVASLLDRCAELEPRIKVIHQKENMGAWRNFLYLLNAATSDYFMWAADDDEWDKRFIRTCMEQLATNNVGTVMPGYYWEVRGVMPKLEVGLGKMEGKDRFSDVMAFYTTVPHHIFYGLHRRETILWVLGVEESDFDDEFFVVNQILRYGVLTLPEKVLFCAGVDNESFPQKLPKEASDRYYYQCRRLLSYAKLLDEVDVLTDVQKLLVLQQAALSCLRFVLTYEKGLRNDAQYDLALRLHYFISQIDFHNLDRQAPMLNYAGDAIRRLDGIAGCRRTIDGT